jgi:hypothetical protein
MSAASTGTQHQVLARCDGCCCFGLRVIIRLTVCDSMPIAVFWSFLYVQMLQQCAGCPCNIAPESDIEQQPHVQTFRITRMPIIHFIRCTVRSPRLSRRTCLDCISVRVVCTWEHACARFPHVLSRRSIGTPFANGGQQEWFTSTRKCPFEAMLGRSSTRIRALPPRIRGFPHHSS